MSVKINCVVLDDHTLKLTQDAKAGDIIDLNDIEIVDRSHIEKLFEEEKDVMINERIKSAKLETKAYYEEAGRKTNSEHKLAVQTLKDNYTKQIGELEKEIALKDSKLESIASETETKVSADYVQKIASLEGDYKLQCKGLEEQIRQNNLEWERKFDRAGYEHREQMKDLEQSKKDELTEKDTIIANLRRERSERSVKLIGENLEEWCLNEYKKYSSTDMAEYTVFEKANEAIKDPGETRGTKPDFLFRVYRTKGKHEEGDKCLTSACLEMKSEDPNSKTKRKNSDFYEKLDKDRTKNDCMYAILVSELESNADNDVPIYKVPEYEDMYVVRPQYMMFFLNNIFTFDRKFGDLIDSRGKEAMVLKKQEELINEFNKFKKGLIEKPVKTLTDEILGLQGDAKKMEDLAIKMENRCTDIINENLKKMKESIDSFDIKENLAKQYDNLEKAEAGSETVSE